MIVITAPTGQIGSQLLDRLLPLGIPIRVITRDATRLPSAVAGSIDVVEGSHRDPVALDRAFEGAEQVFWLVPAADDSPTVYEAYVGFSIPAADAIVRHGVRRIVTVSALGRERQRHAGLVSASLAMDDLLRSTGAHLRALTMPSFMDNLLWQVQAMKSTGMFFSPISGSIVMPTVATRDIARAAADLLLDPEWTGQGSQPLLGHESLSFDDMAVIMSEALGTPIRFRQITPEAYRDGFRERGFSPAMAQAMLDMALAKDAGIDNEVSRVAGNTTETSFRQWCEDTLRPAFSA